MGAKKIKGGIFLLFLILLMMSEQGEAISAVPSSFSVDYVEGKRYEFNIDYVGEAEPLVKFSGWENYTEVVSVSGGERGIYRVQVAFTMPPEVGPGRHELVVFLSDTPPPRRYGEREETGVGAVARLGVPIRFYIMYPDKYLMLEGFEWDKEIKKGEILFFKVKLRSIGKKVIEEATGRMVISGQGGEYEARLTSQKDIQPEQGIELLGEWSPPEEAELGRYTIKGTVTYDGEELNISERKFRYGDRVLRITSFSPEEVEIGGIVGFEVEVQNFWPEELAFSAKVNIYDQGGNLKGGATSASSKAEANKKGRAEVYIDTGGWKEGSYSAEVELDYEGEEEAKETFELRAVKAEVKEVEVQEPKGSANAVLVAVIVVLLLIIIGYSLWKRWQRGEEYE